MAVAVALAMGGCTSDDAPDEAASPGASPSPTSAPSSPADESATPTSPSPSPSPSPSATASPTEDATSSERPPIVPTTETPDLDARCTLRPDLPQVDTISYAVPSDWRVEGSCEVLDPQLQQLPEATEAEAAILVGTSGVSFREAAQPGGATRVEEVWLGAVAGYQASRTTSVSTGQALRPEGEPVTGYLVDLDAGIDDQGGILTMSTGVPEGEAYELAQATLDAIADTLVIDPPAPDAAADGFAVLRQEAGGRPYAVTFDGECFRLRPGSPSDEATAEQCDLDPTAGGPLVAGLLDDDIVVGYAPAAAIGINSNVENPTNALTASIEGGTVFALRGFEVPDEVTAIGPGGEELVTAPVGQ